MKLPNKFLCMFENALHWKASRPPHDSYFDRQNSPPDERDAEFAEARAANESMGGGCDADELEHELVGTAGARRKNTQSQS